ncbi:unnamed protein product [Calypogeia fissa]
MESTISSVKWILLQITGTGSLKSAESSSARGGIPTALPRWRYQSRKQNSKPLRTHEGLQYHLMTKSCI